jgi:broad specificity phosphatase PhoE
MAIYLQRHGECTTNVSKIFACRLLDPELTEFGKSQIIKKLSFYRDKKIRKTISSPSIRAIQSAEILAQGLGIGYEYDHNLLEVDVGDLEGKSELDAENLNYFFKIIKQWLNDSGNISFPSGESKEDVERRIRNIENKYFDEDDIILIGHVTIFAMLLGKYIKAINVEELFLPRGGCAAYFQNQWTIFKS